MDEFVIAARVAARHAESARLDRVLKKEMTQALQGLGDLVKKLQRTLKTLNPQNMDRADLEETTRDLVQAQSEITELGRVDI